MCIYVLPLALQPGRPRLDLLEDLVEVGVEARVLVLLRQQVLLRGHQLRVDLLALEQLTGGGRQEGEEFDVVLGQPLVLHHSDEVVGREPLVGLLQLEELAAGRRHRRVDVLVLVLRQLRVDLHEGDAAEGKSDGDISVAAPDAGIALALQTEPL